MISRANRAARPDRSPSTAIDVLCFEHRTNAVADRLATVSDDNLDRDAEMVADEFEQLTQSHGLHGVSDFGRRPDRQIDHKMGHTGREFLRHDRGDHLLTRVDASGRSTEIRMSSAGDRLTWPPQIRQPWQAFTTSFISSTSRSTRASTSMVSAVPAGDVIAREDVFGIIKPCAATIGTTIIEVRLPGMPPMQCLSTTILWSHFSCVPACAIALRQRKQFAARHETRRADQERGDLHVGITVVDNVIDDRADLGRAQRAALNFGAHCIEAVRWRRRR